MQYNANKKGGPGASVGTGQRRRYIHGPAAMHSSSTSIQLLPKEQKPASLKKKKKKKKKRRKKKRKEEDDWLAVNCGTREGESS